MAEYCENGYSFCTDIMREHGYPLISLFIFDFVFQLVQVLLLIILDVVTVRMKTIMLVVALMAVTVVDLMSRLNTAQHVNAWEKI